MYMKVITSTLSCHNKQICWNGFQMTTWCAFWLPSSTCFFCLIFIVPYLQLNLHAFSLRPYRYLPCIFDATNGSKKCCRKPRHEMSTKFYIYICFDSITNLIYFLFGHHSWLNNGKKMAPTFRLIGCMIGAINAVTELKYILDISFNKNVKESSNMILNRVV